MVFVMCLLYKFFSTFNNNLFRSFELSRTRCVSIVEEDEGYVKLVAKTVAGCDQMYKCVRKLEILNSITIIRIMINPFYSIQGSL